MENRFPKYFSVVRSGRNVKTCWRTKKYNISAFQNQNKYKDLFSNGRVTCSVRERYTADASRSTRHKQKQNVVTRPLSTFLADLSNKLYKSDMSDRNVYDCYMSIQHNSIVILKRVIYLQNSVFQYHVFQTLRVLKTILPAGLNFAK